MRQKRTLRLKTFSTVAMLVAVACGSYFATARLPEPIVDRMLAQDISSQAALWRKRVVTQLEDGAESFLYGRLSETDKQFLSVVTLTSDLYRFKMFTPEGRIFWSSRQREIGSVTTKPYFKDVVMKGTTYYTHGQKPAVEIDGLNLHALNVSNALQREVAEVYTPIIFEGKPVGAIEFYEDITDIRATFIHRVQLTLGIASGIGVALLTVIVMFITLGNRRQMNWLRRQASEQHESMETQLRLAKEVRLLGELNEWLQSSRSLEELFEMVARFMTHMLPESEGSVYVYSNSRDVLDGSSSWNGASHKEHIHPESCWGLRRGRTYTFGDSEVDFVCEHTEPHDDRPYFCFPILAHGETVGLMHLKARHDANREHFDESRKLAQMCAEQISLAIANVRMRDQLHDQSVRDPLTGLFNRRHMTDSLRKLITRAQKNSARMSLVSIDVDHFKKFNDNHGHDAGDMVLRAVGAALDQACDGDELACRMGGEEFMLLLPDLLPETVEERAEKLRGAIEDITVRYGEKTLPRITISVGISYFPEHGMMPQDLMRVADEALYEAKAHGRNQIVVAEHHTKERSNPPKKGRESLSDKGAPVSGIKPVAAE